MTLGRKISVVVFVIALLLPSLFSGLVWGPLNPLVHAAAVLVFVVICGYAPNAAVFMIPVVALFLSFMPYFDWLQYSDSFRGAHFPRLELVKAQFQGHLFSFLWSLTFLLSIRFFSFRSVV